MAPISPAKSGSVARQPNSVLQHNQRNSSVASTGHRVWRCPRGKDQVKEMCLEMFLKGSDWNGWNDTDTKSNCKKITCPSYTVVSCLKNEGSLSCVKSYNSLSPILMQFKSHLHIPLTENPRFLNDRIVSNVLKYFLFVDSMFTGSVLNSIPFRQPWK